MAREFTIINDDGEWITNPCQYAFNDPQTGHTYFPGQLYKVTYDKDSWIAGQIEARALALADDPTVEAPEGSKSPSTARGPKGSKKPA
jgi:hypothetical protein